MSDAMNGRLVTLSSGVLARVLMCCGTVDSKMDDGKSSPSAVFMVELQTGPHKGKVYSGLIDGCTLAEES